MKKIYDIYLVGLLILTAVSAIVIFGCSGDKKESAESVKENTSEVAGTEKPDQVFKKELLTFNDTLEAMLNKPWARLLYDDYSGFYENEFSYLTDDVPFDEYLTYRQVTYRYPLDVINIKVLNSDKFADDSAFVDVEVTLVDSVGTKTKHDQSLTVYHTDGRWIKPTVSIIKYQNEYEEKIRQAIKDAEEG